MAWRKVPIYVTNFNNLERGFRRLVAWLRIAGHDNVTVIDNASTWPLLQEFYAQSPELMVVRLTENKGPYAFWELGMHKQQTAPFVVTDPDVVPTATCPHNLVGRMCEALEELPDAVKVGPSLRIDNLPPHYRLRDEVIEWEQQFWQHPLNGLGAYEALLDTTFALYRPRSEAWPPQGTHYRLAPPYSVEHVPWYEDSTHESAEHTHYKLRAKREFVHW
jgi:hypothetical protein